MAEGLRERTDESVEDWGEEARFVEGGAVRGIADLLLVMPALGVFAGDVEPVGSGFGAGPAYGSAEGVGIEAHEICVGLAAGMIEQVDDDARAETARDVDPLMIDAIDEGDEVGIIFERAAGDGVIVAAARKISEVATEDVKGDVFDGPLAGGCREIPFFGRKIGEKGEEMPAEFGEEVGGFDRG